MSEAENILIDMLQRNSLPVKSAYSREEVTQILQISDDTFYRCCEAWEPLDRRGRDKKGLRTYRISTHYRVPFCAIVQWLDDNLVDA